MNKNETLAIALFLNTMLLALGIALTPITLIGWVILVVSFLIWRILISEINNKK